MDIWEILEIEKTQDITAIKRAYTSKAKKIDREQNPDEFMKLHEAYKTALNYSKNDGPIVVSVPQVLKQEEKTPETPFDFGSVNLNSENVKSDDVVSMIISDIIEFRRDNHLSEVSYLVRMEPGVFSMCVNQLTKMYVALARATDDETIWDSFVEEPIIEMTIEDRGYREFLKSFVPEGSKHMDKLNSICEEAEVRYQKQKALDEAHNAELTRQSIKREKMRKRGMVLIFIGIFCLVTGPFILMTELFVLTLIGNIFLVSSIILILAGLVLFTKEEG